MDEEKQEKLKKRLFISMGIFVLVIPLLFDLFHSNRGLTLDFLHTYMFHWPVILCVIHISWLKGSRIKYWFYFLMWWTWWMTIGIALLCLIRGYRLDWTEYAVRTLTSTIALFLTGLLLGSFVWTFCGDD